MEWQPIETAPKEGEFIAAYFDTTDGAWVIGVWSRILGNAYWAHWMPLPPPPKAIEEEE